MKLGIYILLSFWLLSDLCAQAIDNGSYLKVQEGLVYFEQGDVKAAIKKYNEAIKINKTHEMAYYEKAIAHYRLGKNHEVIKLCKQLIEFDGSYKIDAYLLMADVYQRNKNLDKLTIILKGALKENKLSKHIAIRLAQIYRLQGKHSKAERTLLKSLETDPKNIDGVYELVYTMMSRKKHIKSIIAIYKYLMLDPIAKDAGIFYNILNNKLDFILSKNIHEHEVSYINKYDIDNLKYEDEFEALVDKTNRFIEGLQVTKGYVGGFWWDHFIDHYKEIIRSDKTYLLVYHIAKSQGVQDLKKWNNYAFDGKKLMTYKDSKSLESINFVESK